MSALFVHLSSPKNCVSSLTKRQDKESEICWDENIYKISWNILFTCEFHFHVSCPARRGGDDHYKYSLSMCSCWRIHCYNHHLMSVNFTFLWNQQSSQLVDLTTNGNINHWKQIYSQFFFNPHFPVESLVPTYVSISLLRASHQFP